MHMVPVPPPARMAEMGPPPMDAGDYAELCYRMMEMPFKLASGALCAVEPTSSGRPYLATLGRVTAPVMGTYW